MKYTNYLLPNVKESTVEAKLEEVAGFLDDCLAHNEEDEEEVEVDVDYYFDPTEYFTKEFCADPELLNKFYSENVRYKMTYRGYYFKGVLGQSSGDTYKISLVFNRTEE